LKLIESLFIIILFSISFSQESGFFSSSKKSSAILSVSTLNSFNKGDEINSKSYNSIQFDYKSKSPFEFWIKGLYDSKQSATIGTFGLAYLLKTKKWNVSLYMEKSFHEKDYDQDIMSLSSKDFYLKNGWIFYFKNKIPLYLKYTNIYKETINENKFDKEDRLAIGSYIPIDKLIISFNFDLDMKDFLNLDFNGAEVGLTLGYKIL